MRLWRARPAARPWPLRRLYIGGTDAALWRMKHPRSFLAGLASGFLLRTADPPRREESTPQTFGNVLSSDWIPALRQAQGKLFAGMTGGSSGSPFQMTPPPGVWNAVRPRLRPGERAARSLRRRAAPHRLPRWQLAWRSSRHDALQSAARPRGAKKRAHRIESLVHLVIDSFGLRLRAVGVCPSIGVRH